MKKLFNCILFLLPVAAILTLSSCKKSSEPKKDNTKPDNETEVITPVTNKEVNTIADQSIAAYNSTFLSAFGNTQYYKTSITNAEKDYFWCQALEIQMMEDVYLRTKTSAHKTLISNLLDTFLAQNKGPASLYDWDWNEFNDDILWAGIAFARGYHITGDATFLTQAKYAFNRAYDRGWDDQLGGGIWWDIRKNEKSGLSNNTAVILACYIYEATRDEVYLTKANAIYAWMRSKIYNAATGEVYENMRANGSVATDANVYNVGAFVSAANQLYRITGKPEFFDDAKRSVDYVVNNKTVNGVMTHGTRNGTWQSEFSRGIGEFVRDNNLWSTYYIWMKKNADAAWATRRADLNIGWNQWITQTPKDNSTALECVGTVVQQQITPATQPGIAEGESYRFTPKLNAAVALNSNAGKVNIAKWASATEQKYKVVAIGRGYYRLVPQSAGNSSINVAGITNGSAVDIAGTATTTSQYWKLVYDYDGFYKLKPQSAPLSCLNLKDKKPNEKTACVLWQEINNNSELWLPQKQ